MTILLIAGNAKHFEDLSVIVDNLSGVSVKLYGIVDEGEDLLGLDGLVFGN